MRNELRYQAKIHAISDMPRKEKNKIPCYMDKTIKTCYMDKTSKD
jgi:hypothetical protein